MTAAGGPPEVVTAHVEAFNACDLDGVMAGFDDEAVFTTAEHLAVGSRAISRLFADSFSAPASAELAVERMVVDGDSAACEMTERITAQGVEHLIDVAAFYTVRGGRIVRVRIYRDIAG